MPTGPKGQKPQTAARQKATTIGRWEGEGGAAMPKRPKRPAGVVGNTAHDMQIATREAEEIDTKPEQNAAAAELGRKGGAARAKNMSPERRVEVARKAAAKRWAKPDA